MSRIVMRCEYGYPVLLESSPDIDGKPFPTLYWLSCPHLVKQISHLESQGWIRKFEELIARDNLFRERYLRAHSVIRELRAQLARDEGIRAKLNDVGSGGIRDLRRVKCLHLHVSDYLAGVDNPVGEAVLKKIGTITCERNRVLCK
ncbi:MAG: DUF501 domain-containing protein [Pseudothermotoga sp.]